LLQISTMFVFTGSHSTSRRFCLVAGFVLNVHATFYKFRSAQSIDGYDHTWDASMPALVLRDGNFTRKASRDLVPGDIVHVTQVSRTLYLSRACIAPNSHDRVPGYRLMPKSVPVILTLKSNPKTPRSTASHHSVTRLVTGARSRSE
jgi:hypothetical protein